MRFGLEELPEDAAFRLRFLEWLRGNLPERWLQAVAERDPAALEEARRDWDWFDFLARLGEAGYAAPSWPERHGGLAAGRSADRIVGEELHRMHLPLVSPNVLGIGMAGPTLIAHGSEEQQQRYLPKILTCEEIWCQLFSEPGAGSDLAGLATRARPEKGGFRISGQKVWTSLAQVAKWGMLLARSDPDLPKHAGLTWFILDMESPGVEVRPLRQMTGEAEFNEVFLDEAHVPDQRVVGGVGNGWEVAKTTLLNERVALSGPVFGGGEPHLDLLQAAAGVPVSGPLRHEVSRRYIEAEVRAATSARMAAKRSAGAQAGPEGSIGKIYNAELNQRLTATRILLYDAYAMLGDERYPQVAEAVRSFLRARANTIEGGTSEILRNLIGERVLGLPREPRVDLDLPWRDLPK
ncbi:MAG: acyl-CoA dehydrogenase family protein [Actinomycetota bacterium]|nr:acyl-CoA dehydrogenase family protein [Actinomycetota bacterium]